MTMTQQPRQTRERPSLDELRRLSAEARKLIPGLDTADDPYACMNGADALVILTEWDQFRALDLDRVKDALRQPVVVDLRNIYKPADMAQKGFRYISVGR